MTIQRSRCRTCSSQEQAFRDRNAILMFANQAYNDHRDPCTIGRTRRCCASLVYLPCMLSGPKGRTNKYNQIGALNDVWRSFHIVSTVISFSEIHGSRCPFSFESRSWCSIRWTNHLRLIVPVKIQLTVYYVLFKEKIYYYIIQIYILRKNSIEH